MLSEENFIFSSLRDNGCDIYIEPCVIRVAPWQNYIYSRYFFSPYSVAFRTYELLVVQHYYGKVNDNKVYRIDLDTTFASCRILRPRDFATAIYYRCQGHSRITKTSVRRIDGSLALASWREYWSQRELKGEATTLGYSNPNWITLPHVAGNQRRIRARTTYFSIHQEWDIYIYEM